MKSLTVAHAKYMRLGHVFSLLMFTYVIFSILPTVSSAAERQLERGMYGEDVRSLQVLLNTDSETMVALTGAGSPGKETTFFGQATDVALTKFQKKHLSEIIDVSDLGLGLGVYGPVTQAFVATRVVSLRGASESLTASSFFSSGSQAKVAPTPSVVQTAPTTAPDTAPVTVDSSSDASDTPTASQISVNNPGVRSPVSNVQTIAITTNATVCAREGRQCVFTGTKEVRYGRGMKFVTKIVTGGTACTNAIFGDPIKGTTKYCYVVADTVPEVKVPVVPVVVAPFTPAVVSVPVAVGISANAKMCSLENDTCSFAGTKEVRYGSKTNFVSKTVTGGTACTNAVFGDPIKGTVKACYVVSDSNSEVRTPASVLVVVPVIPAVAPANPVVPVVVKPVAPVVTPAVASIPSVAPAPVPVVVPPVAVPVAPAASIPVAVDKNTNIISNKGTGSDNLGCEIVNQYYIESNKVAKYKWKSFNADSITINGKKVLANTGELITSEIPFGGSKATAFELVVSKAGESKTCRVIVPPVLAKCTATLTDNALDKTLVDYKVTFPVVPGAPYQLSSYNFRGYPLSTYSSAESATANTMSYIGTLAKTAVADKKDVQFITRMLFPTNQMASMMNNSKCVTKYNSSAPVVTPVNTGSSSSGSGTGSTGTSVPTSGTSAPKSGTGFGTPSMQNGLLNF